MTGGFWPAPPVPRISTKLPLGESSYNTQGPLSGLAAKWQSRPEVDLQTSALGRPTAVKAPRRPAAPVEDVRMGLSARGQLPVKRSDDSIDDFVRAQKYGLGDSYAQCLGGPQVDDKLKLGGLLNR